MAILAISQAFIWGFSGILCFGQASFFGLGAYTYALAVINMGESTLPVLLAVALPGLFARKMNGWNFLFYQIIVSFVAAIIVGNIVGGIISAVIGLYVLFQIKSYYH